MQIRDVILRQQSKFETKQDRQMFRRAVLTTEGGLQTSSDPLNDVWANRNERRVWHMADGATQPAQVLCRKVSNPYVGLGVIIGYADGSNAKEVLTTDFFLTGAGTNLDGWDDTGPEDLEPGGNKLHWIYTKVITPLATYPDPTGLTVNVIRGDYPYLGARKTFTGSASYALTQNPNAGQHYLAGLYLDAANTLQVVYGASVSTATTAPEPSWPAGAFRLSAVLIDDVQTSIDFDTDIFDRRMAWSDEEAGSSGWPFAHVLTVSATDPDADYSTIGAAITASSNGDVILIDAGTFNETLTLNKQVTLRGAGKNRTFIDSTGDVTLTITTLLAVVESIGIYNHSSSATTVAAVKCGVNGVLIRDCYVSKYGANSTIAAGVWNSGAAQLILDNVTVVGEPTGTSSYGLYSDVSSSTDIIHGNFRGGTDDIFGSNASALVNLFLPILYTPSYSWAGTASGWFTDTSGGLRKIGSGGTSQYVKQATANGALTVGTIAAADLPAASESAQGAAEIATQAETDAGTDDLRIVTPLKLTSAATVSHPLPVLNTSGATAAVNDVGYLDYTAASGIEYKTTTTVLDDKAAQACVVVVGGANNTTIEVRKEGRYIVPYTGSAPAAGDYMVFSSTATKLTLSTIMRPEVCAIAMAAGAGGVVDVLLLTGRVTLPLFSTNNVFQVASAGVSDFVATINGTPSGTSVTYNAPSSGNENTILPGASTELAKLVLHNTTRGTDALISTVNTGTNVITLTATVPAAWASGDTITTRSQTNTFNFGAGAAYMYDLQVTSAEVPALATALILFVSHLDTSAANRTNLLHPFASHVSSKDQNIPNQVTSITFNISGLIMPLLSRSFTHGWNAGGVSSHTTTLSLTGVIVATP